MHEIVIGLFINRFEFGVRCLIWGYQLIWHITEVYKVLSNRPLTELKLGVAGLMLYGK